MATLTLTINGRPYDIACDDSQVARIQQLGRDVDSRAEILVRQIGQVPDTRLLLMVSLMLADELTDAREQVRNASPDVAAAAALAAAAENDGMIAQGIEALAQRIENIAELLENS